MIPSLQQPEFPVPYSPKWPAITGALSAVDRDSLAARGFLQQLLLLDRSTAFGQDIAKRFPEYFWDDEVESRPADPIPLTHVQDVAIERASRSGVANAHPNLYPCSHGATDELCIPVVELAIEHTAKMEWDIPLMPHGWRGNLYPGDVVELNGVRLVLLEYNDNPGVNIAFFANIERVNPTC